MKDCLRCGQLSGVSEIGGVLVNFVCDGCRLDSEAFHYGHDVSIKAMEYQMAESSRNTKYANG
jgi:hypothetical protein